MHLSGFPASQRLDMFYGCLALDVGVSVASFYTRPLRSLGICSWILKFNDLIASGWIFIYVSFLLPYAALFLSRDSGCKNTLI